MSASAGRVLLQGKGDYAAATTYSPLDWVRYQGKAYVCKAESTGNAPTNTSYWNLLAQDGEEGQVSLDMLYGTVGWTARNKVNYDAWKGTNVSGGTGVYENYGVTLTATGNDCYTSYGNNSNEFPAAARIPVEEGKTYVFTWECDQTTEYGKVMIMPNGSATGRAEALNNAERVEYTAGSGVSYVTFRFGISNHSGSTVKYSNFMCQESSISESSFEPHHESVDVAKANNSALGHEENGTTASQAYAQGAHFMRNGQFATAKTAISSGATLTENSNYTVGNVGDSLVYKAGDQIKVATSILFTVFQGFVTNSSKSLLLTIPLDKPVAGTIANSTVSINKITARGVSGYVIPDNSTFSGNYTVSQTSVEGNLLSLNITKADSTAFNATNNTPVAVSINTLTATVS